MCARTLGIPILPTYVGTWASYPASSRERSLRNRTGINLATWGKRLRTVTYRRRHHPRHHHSCHCRHRLCGYDLRHGAYSDAWKTFR